MRFQVIRDKAAVIITLLERLLEVFAVSVVEPPGTEGLFYVDRYLEDTL